MSNSTELYEDRIRLEKSTQAKQNRYSRYCDFVYYPSSVDPDITLAMRVFKPEKPSYLVASTHGWHMSIGEFCEYDCAQSDYLFCEVDMRGRAFSDGKQDCNGWELYDVIDAVEYVKEHYRAYLLDPSVLFFEAGSGGGGNAYAIAGKFPDYFSAVVAMCGMSDYRLWYQNDKVGEFRDELDVWIGDPGNAEAYASRSGITAVGNLCSPLAIVHGRNDIRVPVYHAQNYVKAAKECGKDGLIQYWEVPDVGGADHWSHATPAFFKELTSFRDTFLLSHKEPVSIPSRGEMKVCGYLFTKPFSVVLDSLDKVATVAYDLASRTLTVTGVAEGCYRAHWNE